jgi:hypothetical protein
MTSCNVSVGLLLYCSSPEFARLSAIHTSGTCRKMTHVARKMLQKMQIMVDRRAHTTPAAPVMSAPVNRGFINDDFAAAQRKISAVLAVCFWIFASSCFCSPRRLLYCAAHDCQWQFQSVLFHSFFLNDAKRDFSTGFAPAIGQRLEIQIQTDGMMAASGGVDSTAAVFARLSGFVTDVPPPTPLWRLTFRHPSQSSTVNAPTCTALSCVRSA